MKDYNLTMFSFVIVYVFYKSYFAYFVFIFVMNDKFTEFYHQTPQVRFTELYRP